MSVHARILQLTASAELYSCCLITVSQTCVALQSCVFLHCTCRKTNESHCIQSKTRLAEHVSATHISSPSENQTLHLIASIRAPVQATGQAQRSWSIVETYPTSLPASCGSQQSSAGLHSSNTSSSSSLAGNEHLTHVLHTHHCVFWHAVFICIPLLCRAHPAMVGTHQTHIPTT